MVTYTCELCGFSSVYSTRYRDHCMTRKHFRKIASILRERKADPLLIRDFARMCAGENQYFDWDRFYIAAGLEE